MVAYKVKPMPTSKYTLKCPKSMEAKGVTLHNTYNDASAENEISYMQRNDTVVGYHIAVDPIGAIEGIPLNRNAWHAGDGANGYGNRNTIGIEICYSKSGGTRYDQAETNAIKLVAKMLHERGWDISKVKKHQDWSGKNCPHRILARSRGWEGILKAIQDELNTLKTPSKPVAKPQVEEEQLMELSQSQRDQLSNVYKLARTKGIFSSDEHEKDIKNGKMTVSKVGYLNGLIAGALLNNGKRV